MKKKMSIEDTLDLALDLVSAEIVKLKKNQIDKLLQPKEANLLNDYVKTLIAAKKEERVADMQDDIDKLSDAELRALAGETIKIMGGK